MKVALQELKESVRKGVEKLGYNAEDTLIITDTLLYAQMRGNNQGIAKIATGGVPKAADIEQFKIVKENKCGALFSGGHSMVSAMKAAEKAVELAAIHGAGIVGVNHTFSSSGAIGYFARAIAKKGYIGFVSVGNASALVAPHGLTEPVFGTNPLSYAFPHSDGQIVFDSATASIAYYGVIEAYLKGEPIPDASALDKDGNYTTTPEEVIDMEGDHAMLGAILPFAGAKGSGLSLFVQMLGAAFTQGGFAGHHSQEGAGTFVLAIDTGLLGGRGDFNNRVDELIETMRSARKAKGSRLYLPGEHGDELSKRAETSGEIEIADGVWSQLQKFLDN